MMNFLVFIFILKRLNLQFLNLILFTFNEYDFFPDYFLLQIVNKIF